MPTHTQTVKCDIKSTGRDVSDSPVNTLPEVNSAGTGYGTAKGELSNMKSDMIEPVGSSQPVGKMQPWSAMNYIICLEGTYPDRP